MGGFPPPSIGLETGQGKPGALNVDGNVPCEETQGTVKRGSSLKLKDYFFYVFDSLGIGILFPRWIGKAFAP